MAAVIQQNAAAAFPDRPQRENAIGLRCIMTNGAGSASVERALPSPVHKLGARVMVSVGNLAGGDVMILQGGDADDEQTFAVWVSSSGGIYAHNADVSKSVAGDLVPGLLWQCVEVVLKPGVMELWINGQLVDDATIDAQSATVKISLGVIDKDTAAVGQIDLDEIKIASGYGGPVVVPSIADHASPRRWLVLYDAGNPDSVTWVQWYRGLHDIPWANLIAIDEGYAGEDITLEQALTLRARVLQYGAINRISVSGVVIGYGMPGTIGGVHSLASLLASKSANLPVDNPSYQAGQVGQDTIDLPRLPYDGPTLLVGELNAPSLMIAMGMSTGIAARSTDSLTGPISTLTPGTDEFRTDSTEWAAWLDLADTWNGLCGEQVRLHQVDARAFGAAIAFTRSSNAVDPLQSLTLAATIADDSALAVRSGSGWAKAALQAGYPIVLGMVGAPGLLDRPNPAALFAALRAGKVLGEAVAYAVPGLLSNWRVLGDPLAICPMPRQGVEVRKAETGLLVKVVPINAASVSVPSDRLGRGEWNLNVSVRDQHGTPGPARSVRLFVNDDNQSTPVMIAPSDLRAVATTNGYIALTWEAIPSDGRVEPALWRVIDHQGAMQGEIAQKARQRIFALNCGPFADGATVRLSLMPVNADGDEGRAVAFPVVIADAAGPAVPVLLQE